jgi:hypothetical protein
LVSIRLSSLDENPIEGRVGHVLACAEVEEFAETVPLIVDAATLVDSKRI